MKRFSPLGIFICLLVLFAVVTPQTLAAGFTDGLVVYLSLDEGKGDTAKDLSKNKHDGKITKPKWADGKFSKALQFGGEKSGTFVHVKSTKLLNVDQFTAMAWVNFENWDGVKEVIGKSVHGGCTGRGQYGLFSEGGVLKLRMETEGGRADITGKLPATKKWVHLTCTNNGKEGRILVDGKEIGKGKTPGKLKPNDDPWAVGQDCERLNYIPTGLIDEARLWNRALSDKEIGEYMNMGAKDAFAVTAVTPKAKLPVTWSKVKTSY